MFNEAFYFLLRFIEKNETCFIESIILCQREATNG